jgi:hypothetical protein
MRFSENLSNIAGALARVQAEIKNPIKDQTNKGVQGAPKYANLEDTLSEYVRPILTKHGMSFFQPIKSDESGRVGVCTVLFHESGEFIEGDYVFCDVVIPLSKQGNKVLTEGQATGVCITYLRRYSLNAALGINGDKDTDGSYNDEPEQEEPLTYETALALEITFGQHNGKTLAEIWKEDTKYINYLLNNAREERIKEAIRIIDAEIKKNKSLSRNVDATNWENETQNG